MASSMVQSLVGKHVDCFAAVGVVAVSYVTLKLALSILSGIRSFVLSKPLGLGTNLKTMGAWAVVTGCTDGIGKAYTEQIAKEGLNMVLISRTRFKLDELAKEIENKYKVKTLVVVADFSKGAPIYQNIKEQISRLDIGVLVNNVGLGYEHPAYLHEIPNRDKHFVDLIEVNVTSVTMMTSIVIQGMIDKKKGVIINLSSAAGLLPTPLLTVYSACKYVEEKALQNKHHSFKPTLGASNSHRAFHFPVERPIVFVLFSRAFHFPLGFVDFFSVCVQEEYKSKGIKIQSVMPYFVTTKMNKMLKTSWIVPSPDTFVRSALATVGLETRTNGFWIHNLMGWLNCFIPFWLSSKLTIINLNSIRVNAFKQLAASKAQ